MLSEKEHKTNQKSFVTAVIVWGCSLYHFPILSDTHYFRAG